MVDVVLRLGLGLRLAGCCTAYEPGTPASSVSHSGPSWSAEVSLCHTTGASSCTQSECPTHTAALGLQPQDETAAASTLSSPWPWRFPLIHPTRTPTDRGSAEQLSRTAPSTRGAIRMLEVRYSASTAPPPTSTHSSTSERAPQPTDAGAPAAIAARSKGFGEDVTESAPLPCASATPPALARERQNDAAMKGGPAADSVYAVLLDWCARGALTPPALPASPRACDTCACACTVWCRRRHEHDDVPCRQPRVLQPLPAVGDYIAHQDARLPGRISATAVQPGGVPREYGLRTHGSVALLLLALPLLLVCCCTMRCRRVLDSWKGLAVREGRARESNKSGEASRTLLRAKAGLVDPPAVAAVTAATSRGSCCNDRVCRPLDVLRTLGLLEWLGCTCLCAMA